VTLARCAYLRFVRSLSGPCRQIQGSGEGSAGTSGSIREIRELSSCEIQTDLVFQRSADCTLTAVDRPAWFGHESTGTTLSTVSGQVGGKPLRNPVEVPLLAVQSPARGAMMRSRRRRPDRSLAAPAFEPIFPYYGALVLRRGEREAVGRSSGRMSSCT
jgi:hypothetical protein